MEHISVKKKTDRMIISHKIEKTEQINTMVLDMLNKREIQGLLPVQIRNSVFGKKLRCTVQNFRDINTWLKSGVEFDAFAEMILQIITILQKCESQGIPSGSLELNGDFVFFDYSSHKVCMIWWPVISLSVNARVSSFFLDLGAVYVSKRKDQDFRWDYLKFFDNRDKFDLVIFKGYVESVLKRWKNGLRDERDGGKLGIPDSLETRSARDASLLWVSTGLRIDIEKYPFSIGRLPEYCNYAIPGNQFISKKHITVLLRNGRHYIKDNGSANGTYLNGEKIPPNVECKLSAGDCIRIGNDDFVFHEVVG